MNDYERSIVYVRQAEWDNLLILMVRTKDQFLAKKIEKFLHAYHYVNKNESAEDHLINLLQYSKYSASLHEQERYSARVTD